MIYWHSLPDLPYKRHLKFAEQLLGVRRAAFVDGL